MSSLKEHLTSIWDTSDPKSQATVWEIIQEKFGTDSFDASLKNMDFKPSASYMDELADRVATTSDGVMKQILKNRMKNVVRNGHVFLNLPLDMEKGREVDFSGMLSFLSDIQYTHSIQGLPQKVHQLWRGGNAYSAVQVIWDRYGYTFECVLEKYQYQSTDQVCDDLIQDGKNQQAQEVKDSSIPLWDASSADPIFDPLNEQVLDIFLDKTIQLDKSLRGTNLNNE